MQYIVLDMEWNQPWPGSYAAQKVLPVQIHGEIIQIGAVRLLETGKIADEFQVLVRPKYYKKLNSRVSKLTGLRDARLREEGLSFPEALERFRDWIGGPCIFLTWGFDDITVLEDNILLHDGEPDWITILDRKSVLFPPIYKTCIFHMVLSYPSVQNLLFRFSLYIYLFRLADPHLFRVRFAPGSHTGENYSC